MLRAAHVRHRDLALHPFLCLFVFPAQLIAGHHRVLTLRIPPRPGPPLTVVSPGLVDATVPSPARRLPLLITLGTCSEEVGEVPPGAWRCSGTGVWVNASRGLAWG